jgi:hypothetical protein
VPIQPTSNSSRCYRAGHAGSLPWLFLLLLALSPLGAWAQADPGRFDVRAATSSLSDGVWYLNARIEYRLSAETREALEAGVPLTIRLEVVLIENRRWWLDDAVAELRQTYRLEYHALSERYLLHNLNSGELTSFATLFSALNFLGRVQDLPLIDAALISPSAEYLVRLRAVLATEEFPGPLRLLAFWRRDWSLRSEWYTWPLQGD